MFSIIMSILAQHQVINMIKDMITVFIEHIEELEWMDKETKANAIKKVQLIPAPGTSKCDLL